MRALNYARAGANSCWGVERADEVARARPDVVIIEFAINDAAIHRGVSLGRCEANIGGIVGCLRATKPDIRVYLMVTNPVRGLRAILRPRLARYYELYARLSESLRTGFIDNRSAWQTLPVATLERALPDGVHPTEEFSMSITLEGVVHTIARDLRERTKPIASRNAHRDKNS